MKQKTSNQKTGNQKTGNIVPARRALISLFAKNGLAALAAFLTKHDIALAASSGTASALRAAGFAAETVEEITGWPDMLGGRVKTLHPKIHSGILARRGEKSDLADLARHGIAPIDIVIAGLYPFEDVLARGAAEGEIIENIDIGAPAMIRAAAKNHHYVAVLTDMADCAALEAELTAHQGGTSLAFRRALALKAFRRTAAYDAAIAHWLSTKDQPAEAFPARFILSGRKIRDLRYGENPHQSAALYADSEAGGLVEAEVLQGKALSFNNLADAQAAYDLAREFSRPAAAIIKHANPCGAACGATAQTAWESALACDPQSAFGGIVAFNCPLDGETAQALRPVFLELIIAPEIKPDAQKVLAGKKNLRLLQMPLTAKKETGWDIRLLDGGFALQTRDNNALASEDWRCVSKRRPDAQEKRDLLFAQTLARHVKSNAIVLARGEASLGIGAGQMSRIDAAELAIKKAGAKARGSVGASDAFFPFADGLEILAQAGVGAVIQPGGSRRDEEVIAAADKAGLAMIFTGTRHFRH